MSPLTIRDRLIGIDQPVYVIAELSANHNGSFEQAVELVRAAAASGADAVKLQTYRAGSMTIESDREWFTIEGTPWHGRTLFELYSEAQMPWEWQPELMQLARELGLDVFSSVFDDASVAFLEELDCPAYKIASFELVDLPLITTVAGTGKPVILSTGMATLDEIDEAVATFREVGGHELALLKCTSAYPAAAADMNLRTIPDLAARFGVEVGLSDHTLGSAVAVAAVSVGATLIEKHLTLDRQQGGPDAGFSLEPPEFAQLVTDIRTAYESLGGVSYGPVGDETEMRAFRRSLFAVADISAGDAFTASNVRAIRPGAGLHPRHLAEILGATATSDISRGTPLEWSLVSGARELAL